MTVFFKITTLLSKETCSIVRPCHSHTDRKRRSATHRTGSSRAKIPPQEGRCFPEGDRREEKGSPNKKIKKKERMNMIGKKFRIPRADHTTLKAKRRIPGEFLRASIASNTLPHNRFAVVVSNRLAKTATLRHLVKRSIYDACEPFTKKTPNGKDIHWVVLKSIQKNDLPLLRLEIQRLLPRALA